MSCEWIPFYTKAVLSWKFMEPENPLVFHRNSNLSQLSEFKQRLGLLIGDFNKMPHQQKPTGTLCDRWLHSIALVG